jgi:hypothetical protein
LSYLNFSETRLGPTFQKTFSRDAVEIIQRVASEGLSFLTKTLPKLGKALEECLKGFTFQCPREFSRFKGTTRPRFLEALSKRIFSDSGVLLFEPDIDSIKEFYQICMLSYKLELPFSQADSQRVISDFIACELELKEQHIVKDSVIYYANSLAKAIHHEFDIHDIIPKHGPGAVATREGRLEKYNFKRKYQKLHQVYPYYKFFVVGGAREILDRVAWYRSLTPLEHAQARVCLVPKDSRGPRIISSEPLELMWIQQGLGAKLVSLYETHGFTKNHLNFTDQSINRELAQVSSKYDTLVTLDLKAASDQVSVQLVERIFEDTPVLRALLATRSDSTLLPDGTDLPLNKFAPMGSALCFPVEAFIFWAISVAAIKISSNVTLKTASQMVFVYGDDIIVPKDFSQVVIGALERVGLKVNKDKCCLSGNFRESCGMYAFKGIDITPIRLRKPFKQEFSDGACLASYISISNKFRYIASNVSMFIDRALQSVWGFIPYGVKRSSFMCKEVIDPESAEFLNKEFGVRSRYNKDYQRLEYSTLSLIPISEVNTLDSWQRLAFSLRLSPEADPSKVISPRMTKIKRGWTAV